MRGFWRFLLLLAVSCALSASLQAQFVQVSGTVTDTNNLAYACGTITASIINTNGQSLYLNGQPFSPQPASSKLGCPTDPSTSRTPGAYLMSLADNTQIKCASGGAIITCGTQTTWTFLVNTTGILPPLGTGPQTCTLANQTITGASQTVNLAGCPAQANAAGGGGFNPTNGNIDATNPGFSTVGVKGGVIEIFDGTWANTSHAVTSGANDPCFTAVPFAQGSNGNPGLGHIGAAIQFAVGTLSVVSCHSGTMSTTSSGACTFNNGVQNCRFSWGPADDTIAINNVYALANSFGTCPNIDFSNAGLMFVSGALGASAAPTCGMQSTGFGTTGLSIFGKNRYTTQFIKLSSYVYTGCVGGVSGATCNWGWKGVQLTNIGFSGMDDSQAAGNNAKNILESAQDGLIDHVMCEGWGASDAALIGVLANAPGEFYTYDILDGCGGLAMKLAPSTNIYLNDSFLGDSKGVLENGGACTVAGLYIPAGDIAQTRHNGFGPQGTNVDDLCVDGGSILSVNDRSGFQNSVNNTQFHLVNGALANVDDFRGTAEGSSMSTSATPFFLDTTTANNVFVRNSSLTAGSASFVFNCGSTSAGTVHDQGGNFTSANVTNCGGTAALAQYLNGTAVAGASPTITANAGAQTIFTAPATNISAKVYVLYYDVFIATAGTAGAITINLICANGSGTSTQPGAATLTVTNAAGSEASGAIACHLAAGQVAQYSITGITTPGSLSAPAQLRLEPQ